MWERITRIFRIEIKTVGFYCARQLLKKYKHVVEIFHINVIIHSYVFEYI